MFKHSPAAAALLVLLSPLSAPSDAFSQRTIEGNLSFVSNYSFRGISQTMNEPAVQGGFDYAPPSGFYLGTWATNVSSVEFEGGTVELDFYGGRRGRLSILKYDVGATGYYYPGAEILGRAMRKIADYNTAELYAGLSLGGLEVKYSVTATDFFGINEKTSDLGTSGSRGSSYLQGDLEFGLVEEVRMNLHLGHQYVRNFGALDYTDFLIGITRSVLGIELGAAYKNTNADKKYYTFETASGGRKDVAGGALILSASKTF